jgi:hypothetical protein
VRARWESLHAALIRSVTSLPAAEQYQRLRRSEPILARFDSVEALLAYLLRGDPALSDSELDAKDQIYAVLVRTVQTRAPAARVAGELAWCGLWPALDRIYRRRVRHFGDEPDELTQLIWLSFTELLNRLDLARGRRVAASLVRSTDRDVRKARWRAAGGPASDLITLVDPAAVARLASSALPNQPSTVGLSLAGELAELRARLVPLIGADTELVVAILILEVDKREAASRAGLAYPAARKRLQRAVVRLRAQLRPDDGSGSLSQSLDPLVNKSVPETHDEDE